MKSCTSTARTSPATPSSPLRPGISAMLTAGHKVAGEGRAGGRRRCGLTACLSWNVLVAILRRFALRYDLTLPFIFIC
jgi:hypothetical protein